MWRQKGWEIWSHVVTKKRIKPLDQNYKKVLWDSSSTLCLPCHAFWAIPHNWCAKGFIATWYVYIFFYKGELCCMLRAVSPIKITPVSFFQSCWLAIYLVSTVHMHLCTIHTCSHMLTHTHTCCSCKWYFLSSMMCAFSFALFCWIKASSCWRFFTSDRQGTQGKASVGKEKSESRIAEALWLWSGKVYCVQSTAL